MVERIGFSLFREEVGVSVRWLPSDVEFWASVRFAPQPLLLFNTPAVHLFYTQS